LRMSTSYSAIDSSRETKAKPSVTACATNIRPNGSRYDAARSAAWDLRGGHGPGHVPRGAEAAGPEGKVGSHSTPPLRRYRRLAPSSEESSPERELSAGRWVTGSRRQLALSRSSPSPM
jgi:hypothetical protein